MHFDLAQVLSLVIGTVLPLLTGLISRQNTSAGLKAVVLLALSAVSGFLANFLDAVNTHSTFNVGSALLTVLGTFLVGTGVHFGFLKPTGAAAAVQRFGGFIGRPQPAPAPQPPAPPAQ